MTRHRDTGGPPAIPDDNAPLPPARRPTRWTVRRGRAIAFVLLGLAVAASLLSVYLTYQSSQEAAAQAAAVDRRLSVLEEDLADRTRQRDAERDAAAEEQERFRANLCVVLGELPADSRGLDSIRSTLGCTQPGVSPSSGPASQPPAGSSPVGPGAPSPAASTPAAPTAPPAPTSPSPAPTDPAPTTPGLLCGLLPLC